MDALDVVMNKDRVFPFFQPIISADKLEVAGYEVLGFFQDDEGDFISLGFFFQDPSIPEEYRLEIEERIHHIALNQYIKEQRTDYLFLNVDINLVVSDGGEAFFEKLFEWQKQGLPFQNIILEIKEHDFNGELSHLKHFVQYAQSLGLFIALDDVGKSTTHLDEIAYLKPNIIKVDLAFMEDESFPSMFRDVLQSLSLLSKKIGASLLFERIRNFNQLNYAWRHGSRYYQGPYLGKPKQEMIKKDAHKESLKKDFRHFINYERKKIEAQMQLSKILSQRLKEEIKDSKKTADIDELTKSIAVSLEDICFRVYICDNEGFQQSGNAVKRIDNAWEYHAEERNRNWSWRPYFLENIVRMNYEKDGILSDLYADIHREEMIRTYSYPLQEDLYVFIDIPYSYLYEKDFLI
ncbi:EAL-associated domain-containing protein [Alteribacillus sp. HJP-4]|uniref:EAL domain-containing protein n=1 Tax=Alteribacillus sp. HJP-4 TaxID=2775394 RepID=UPI0035CCD7D3